MKKEFHISIIAKTALYRIAFSFMAFIGVQDAFGRGNQEMYVQAINAEELGFITNITSSWYSPDPELEPGYETPIFSPKEKEQTPKPEAEETEEDKEIPQKAPIIPILNRMPALHKKRQKDGEKDKHKKLPWR